MSQEDTRRKTTPTRFIDSDATIYECFVKTEYQLFGQESQMLQNDALSVPRSLCSMS